MSVYNDVIKPNIPNDYQKFAPYLLTVFYFIFLNNLLGLIPLFPGGANVIRQHCGNPYTCITVNRLSLPTFWEKEYWKEIFGPMCLCF